MEKAGKARGRRKKVSCPRSTTSRSNPNLADSPLHAKSHGRSLRDINNNDDRCPIGIVQVTSAKLHAVLEHGVPGRCLRSH